MVVGVEGGGGGGRGGGAPPPQRLIVPRGLGGEKALADGVGKFGLDGNSFKRLCDQFTVSQLRSFNNSM